jgi:hypothetical protein
MMVDEVQVRLDVTCDRDVGLNQHGHAIIHVIASSRTEAMVHLSMLILYPYSSTHQLTTYV